jgi:enamine deaminase RidA (YjgF/YER057c/UK114 family)
MNGERIGYSSGWSVDEGPEGSFHWSAYGPGGFLRGQAETRAAAEQAAQEAEQQLAAAPGGPATPQVRLASPPSTAGAGGPGPQPAPVEEVLERAVGWARQQPDIRGLALVGSWARGSGRADSDVDLVVLTSHPDRYLADDGWTAGLGAARVLRTQGWGALTERRLLLDGGLVLEVGIADPAWAATDPVDAGTRRVVSDGLRILHDPEGRLAALAVAASDASTSTQVGPAANFINPETLHRPFGYTHVVEVTAGRPVYLAGQVALNRAGEVVGAGDIDAQARQVFENLQAALQAVGAGFDQVVKLNLYLVDITQLPAVREVRDQYVNTARPPASTAVEIRRLAVDGLLVEVEAVAVVAEDGDPDR